MGCMQKSIAFRGLVTGTVLGFGLSASAGACVAPRPLHIPSDSNTALEFEDLIRRDFETYISAVQDYFRWLEEERALVFEEAREASREYGAFLDQVDQE